VLAVVLAIIVASMLMVVYMKQWHDWRLECLDTAKVNLYCSKSR
jgi:hypothetical protein